MGRQGMPGSEQLLPGREASMAVAARHAVLDTPMIGPFAEHLQEIYFGLGCFWGAERLFWGLEGVFTTAAGYAGGLTPNPSYEEVCSGRTGHTEVVMVVYDPARISLITLLRQFWNPMTRPRVCDRVMIWEPSIARPFTLRGTPNMLRHGLRARIMASP